jgi:predicted small metal-binding protein
MVRKMVDCRQLPNDIGCTLTMAGEPEELLDAAVWHAVDKHGHQDDAELREQLRGALVDAEPAMAWTVMPIAGVLPALGVLQHNPFSARKARNEVAK